jgi:hypothetical protein
MDPRCKFVGVLDISEMSMFPFFMNPQRSIVLRDIRLQSAAHVYRFAFGSLDYFPLLPCGIFQAANFIEFLLASSR